MLNPVAFSCYKNLNLQKCEDSERTESRKPGKQTKGGFDLARQKDENREKAKQLFLDSDGLMKNTEIAEALGIDSAKVRKWKCVDKWTDTAVCPLNRVAKAVSGIQKKHLGSGKLWMQ